MYNNQNNALAEQKPFMLPSAIPEGEFTQEELAEDMEGIGMSFPRIKIPAGGALQFEIPSGDPENPDYAKTLEGILLFSHDSFTYWAEGNEYDDNAHPLCLSMDGKLGIGEPGGSCSTCVLNQYGTAAEGRGKACKNQRALYLLRSGDFMPLQVTLPPTSLKPFREFLRQAFIFRHRATYGSVIQIGLKKATNGKDDYSVATFRRLSDFSGEELAQVRTYAESFKELVRTMIRQHNAGHESTTDAPHDPGTRYTGPIPTDTSSQFAYGQSLETGYEALPA